MGPILVVGERAGAVASTLDGAEPVHDLDSCLARARSLRATGRVPGLVAVLPSLERPLSAARRLRELDQAIGIAVVVDPGEVPATEAKLAFVPDLPDVTVVPWEPGTELGEGLRTAAEHAAKRRGFDQAISAINRELQRPAAGRRRPASAREGVSERYLAALIRHAPEAIVALDGDGCVVTVNPAAIALLELDDREPEGQALEEFLAAEDSTLLAGIVAALREGEVRHDVELTIRSLDGEQRLLSVTAAPIVGPSTEPAGSVLLARDITAQRRADERLRQLQRAEGLATLAGGVAHDFNNLLMTISGWTTIAEQELETAPDAVPETLRAAIEHIDVAATRAAELARAMLAYSGKGDVKRRPTDLSELVDGMRGLFAASVPSDITVHIELADDIPPVEADPTQLRQVLLNLVTNAAEAIGSEPGRIDVTTRARPDAGDHGLAVGRAAQLEVRDTGHGMDEATIARIFEPFFTTRFAGRGLGLAATFGIVRAHGGSIDVVSESGSGATFVITLPGQTSSGTFS